MIHLSSGKFAIAAVAALVAGSQAVHAADSFDLTVTGVIQPAACEVTIAGGGNFDYGLIPTQKLQAVGINGLGVLSTSFSIVCEAPTRVALHTVDNRMGTVGVGDYSPMTLGLGTDSVGNNIGAWTATIDDVTTDSLTSVVSIDSPNGNSWTAGSFPASGGFALRNNGYLISISAPGETTPAAFTTLSGTLNIEASIVSTPDLNLSESVNLDGSVTVEMVYL